MKSSLLTLIVVSTVVLSGCFNRSENCVSCSGDMGTEEMACSTCPSALEMSEEAIMEDGNEPEMAEMMELSEEEK